jgi:uncharacterized protein
MLLRRCMMTNLLLVLIGVIAGVVSGFFGIAGGIVMIPLLLLLLKIPQSTASGISLMTFLLPVGILGVWQYFKDGRVTSAHIPYSLLLALGIVVGAFIGAKLSGQIPELWLRRSFCFLLVVAAARLWFRP